MVGKHEQKDEPVEIKRTSITLTFQFVIYLVTMLIGIGISIGTYQLSISELRAEQIRTQAEVKDIKGTYLRMDLYEERQKALDKQLVGISEQLREIKEFLFKKGVR